MEDYAGSYFELLRSPAPCMWKLQFTKAAFEVAYANLPRHSQTEVMRGLEAGQPGVRRHFEVDAPEGRPDTVCDLLDKATITHANELVRSYVEFGSSGSTGRFYGALFGMGERHKRGLKSGFSEEQKLFFDTMLEAMDLESSDF